MYIKHYFTMACHKSESP